MTLINNFAECGYGLRLIGPKKSRCAALNRFPLMATEAWRIEHFMFMFMDGGSAVLWGEVECPLHSSEQIATRAAEHGGGGGENYTDGRRTDRPLSLKNEATRLSVWNSGLERTRTRTSSVASFILELIRVERGRKKRRST